MPGVSVYLNFNGTTESAFRFYKSVFGGDFDGGIHRFSEIPPSDGMPPIPDSDKNLVMHVSLPIMDNSFMLMGSDSPESMGFKIIQGNNMSINLMTDSREETDRLFAALSAGGVVEQPMQDMFWGAYYGSCTDQFGIKWMFNFDTTRH
ncbi:MAG TPA: VOC family protein [Saprospiraceae bacterium]|nr:VOC family protein [Saprospiraceae bacterium]